LATSWTQTAPTIWEFRLRPGVKFHDGTALDAAVAAAGLNRVLTAAAPPRAFSPRVIKAVEAVGADTVRITTPDPSPLLPLRLASPSTAILSAKAFQGGKTSIVGTCTGPFEVTQEVPQQSLQLRRNESYWGGKVALAAAEVRFIPDGTGRATQVRTGEAHIAMNIPATALASLRSAPGLRLISIETPRTTGLYLNNKKAPLNDVRVRRAIQSAIDVAAIATAVYEGAAKPAIGPFSPDKPWAHQAAPAKYDVNAAKALLTQAGIAPGTLKLGLFAYTERAEMKNLAAVLQEQLKQIGIQVDIKLANYTALEPDMLSGNYDMTLLSRSHLVDVADPVGYFASDYGCKGTYNISHFCDAAVDAKIDEATKLTSADARFAIYRDLAKKLQEDAVDVFVVHEQANDVISTRVQNYRPHPFAQYALTAAVSIN
jgi:peptide/nickel transport system substrate-binding protein